MTDLAHLDLETKSDVDIRKHGGYRYFESVHTDVLMASYRIGEGPIRRWLPGEPCPADLRQHVERAGKIVAHSASFESNMWWRHLTPKHGWPKISLDQFICSAATAAALGLPRSLEKLGAALGLTARKDDAGEKLIKLFSLPRSLDPLTFNDRTSHPKEFEQFQAYCDRDVETEAEAYHRMIPLSDFEQRVWLHDQAVNGRGIRIDRQSCVAAIALVEREQETLNAAMYAVTDTAVDRCTEVAKLTRWVESRGVALGGLAKDEILGALDGDLPDDVRKALLLRQEAAKSSTSKLRAFLRRMSDDDRLRGAFIYHGTGPGRFSSTGANVANLPRPRNVYAEAHLDPATLFNAIRTGQPDSLRALYGPTLGRPLDLVSDALRSFLWAAPEHDFISVDYSSIQGVINMWLAGEQWKLDAVREIMADPKNVPDLYRRAAAAITGLSTDVIHKKHPLRQSVGKTSELALGFGSGVAGFVAMAKNYKVDLDGLFEPVWSTASDETREKALKRYERCMKAKDRVKTDVLSREAWLACEAVKTAWRATNPMIAKSWGVLEKAARDAVSNPGEAFEALGRVSYKTAHGYLFCRLPSGRCISYPGPKLRDQVWAKLQGDDGSWPDESEVVERELAERLELQGRAKIDGVTSAKVTVLGVDSQSQKFMRYGLYGGLLCENLCLGIERDILVAAMLRLEERGYPVVLHVYDEIVAEVPRGFGSVDEMAALMCEQPPWADGLPIAATGFRAKRYRKE